MNFELKKAILERDKHICRLCTAPATRVDYKDGNEKNKLFDNLIAICNRCHGMQKYYGKN